MDYQTCIKIKAQERSLNKVGGTNNDRCIIAVWSQFKKVDQARIDAFCEKIGVVLPADYQGFLLAYNGGNFNSPVSIRIPEFDKVVFSGNPQLSGDVATGLTNHTFIQYIAVNGTKVSQYDIASAPNIGDYIVDYLPANLFTSDFSDVKEGLQLSDIQVVQDELDLLPSEETRAQWQADVDLAKKMIKAKEIVADLFLSDRSGKIKDGSTHIDIKNSTDQSVIDDV